MLKRVVHSLGLVEHNDKNPRRKNNVRGTNTSPDFGLRSKDLYVRIVHQGGKQEVYHHAFPASMLMAKYPGMCVARAQVFMAPHHSVLRPEEHLLLGDKYVIMSCRDLEKLKRKHPQQVKTKEHNGVVTWEGNIIRSPSEHSPKENDEVSIPKGVACKDMMNTRITLSPIESKINENAEMNVSQGRGDDRYVEEVHRTAKDFYVPKDKPARNSRRKGIKVKKPFSPPLPKGRSYRGLRWHPSLPTVQELSP
uniref:Uncharacterized protein n=1 Tax=Cajanus cajan TaxID=3821 RepID=A0A151TGX4_CAJCA|nr:hypothetical protein KK1_012576 [Cajanus cajan]